ncbi:MAG: 50S ribosomal protein L30 [Candidatus Sericytochromatia bacterium]
MANDKKITVKLTKSPIGYNKNQLAVVQSLGLRKMNSIVEHYDTPTIRGMVHKVRHLVTVTE